MPLITIETNQPLNTEDSLQEMSQFVAALLGKPESYLMLSYTYNKHMLFAGTNEPLAHLQVKSLGMPEDETKDFSSQLCIMIEKYFSVTSGRIYIEFSSPERHLWGWNRTTF